MTEHRWIFCETCDIETVVCGRCGNNVCNGGSGEVGNGKGGTKPCPECESAYQLWKATPIDPKTGRRI